MKNRALICFLLLSVHLIYEAYAAVNRDQMEKMANGFRNTCVGKTGADKSLVEGIRTGNFVDDPASRCYTKCIMSLMKTFTKQGTIDIEMLVKQINIMIPSDLADNLAANARKCYATTSSGDPCELAWLFTKCTYESDPTTFFFP